MFEDFSGSHPPAARTRMTRRQGIPGTVFLHSFTHFGGAMKKLALLAASLLTLGMAGAQTLNYGASGFPVSLDAVDVTDGNSLAVPPEAAERLIRFVPGGAEVVPAVGTSWESHGRA